MVLSSMKINDFDKRLVLLTKEKGKLTAFVKGALKPKSQYVASTQSFAFGEFILYEGKNSNSITSISIQDYFSELSEDLEVAYMAMYFCEFMTLITNENVDEREQLKLLYCGLKALIRKKLPINLIRYIFEYKSLVNMGVAPLCFECTECSAEGVTYYSPMNSGMYCERCGKLQKTSRILNESTFYALQFIAATNSEKLFSFLVNEQVENELRYVAKCEVQKNIDVKFKTLEVLEGLR